MGSVFENISVSPLLLLCKGGATREVLDQVVTSLEVAKKAESLTMQS